jgi:signal transduction histidine kinase
MALNLFLRNNSIRFVSIVSIIIGIIFALINIYYIYPYFTDLLVKNTEKEAIRLGAHLADMYFEDNKPLSQHDMGNVKEKTERQIKDFNLMKMKIFTPSGMTIYSTTEEDIGTFNKNEYFHNKVAKGKPFTKVVKKNTRSLEDEIVTADVVETYVPVMSGDTFIGAFEIYYDITDRSEALSAVMFKSSFIPIITMIIFIMINTGILLKLDKNMIKQKIIEKDLTDYTEKLKKSNSELQSFAHIASHDLQEPLRKVTAFGDRLKARYSDVLGEQGNDYLERMQNAAGRMQHLIQGLLAYSRVTTKAKPFESVDLSTVARGVLSDLEMRIQDSGGRVDIGELPTVSADPLQMRQLFQNMISNALKFHKKDQLPVVKVSAELILDSKKGPLDDKCYQLAFEDNGIGFDAQYEDRIFGVFQRLHGRKEYEGSGIGLSVCKKIAERHGGNISAESTPGEGAKFIVTLPAKQENGENHG